MGQPQLRPTRSVDYLRALSGSLTQPQRLHSEPAHQRPSPWRQDHDHGRRDVRSAGMAYQPRIAVLGKRQQGQIHGGDNSHAASSADNDADTVTDQGIQRYPIFLETAPPVVQRAVSPSPPTPRLETVLQEPSSNRQDVPTTGSSMASILPEPQLLEADSGSESGPGSVLEYQRPRPAPPGRGPGPGPRPDKNHTSRPKIEGSLATTNKDPNINLSMEWKKILKLRAVLEHTRSLLNQSRFDLRLKDDAKLKADDRLMKYLQVITATQSVSASDELLRGLVNDCQRARDEYGPLQDDCALLEDKLELHQGRVNRAEEHLFQQLFLDVPEAEEDDTALVCTDSDSLTSSEDDGDRWRDYHPTIADFLSKLGQVDIFRERLAENREHKEMLEEEKESRLLVNLGLYPENQAFLDTFDDLEVKLLDDIKTAEAAADVLRKKCLRDGLIDDEGNINMTFESWEKQNFRQEPEIYAGSQTSEFAKYPALLPQYGTIDIHLKDPEPETTEVVYNTADRINHWLLVHLRSSPLGVNLLARTYEEEVGPIKGPDNWQNDVLTLWYNDETRKARRAFRIYSSEGQSYVSAPIEPQVQTGDGESTPSNAHLPFEN